MRHRHAFIAALVIAVALGLSLPAGKARAWEHNKEGPDVFGDYSASSFLRSEDGKGQLMVREAFKDDWKSVNRIIIMLGQWHCAGEDSTILRVWIDGWRKNIPGISQQVDDLCLLVFNEPEEVDNLITRINHGNMMQIKDSYFMSAKFDIRGETLILRGEAVK